MGVRVAKFVNGAEDGVCGWPGARRRSRLRRFKRGGRCERSPTAWARSGCGAATLADSRSTLALATLILLNWILIAPQPPTKVSHISSIWIRTRNKCSKSANLLRTNYDKFNRNGRLLFFCIQKISRWWNKLTSNFMLGIQFRLWGNINKIKRAFVLVIYCVRH